MLSFVIRSDGIELIKETYACRSIPFGEYSETKTSDTFLIWSTALELDFVVGITGISK